MDKTNFLTEKEQLRLKRNEMIRSKFDSMRSSSPGVSDNRIISRLAQEFSLTPMAIRYVISRQP